MSNGYENNTIESNNETIVEDNDNDAYSFDAWEDLEISTDLLRGIYAYGYEKPSPIQRKAIQPILQKI